MPENKNVVIPTGVDGTDASDSIVKANRPQQMRLLHIEDSPDHQLIMRSHLRQISWDIEYHCCSSLEEARQLWHENPNFDVVLLDLMLKGESSSSLIQEFRGTPVVVITAHDDEALDNHLMQLGAADFITKSDISAPLLKRVIRHSLERQKILNQLAHESTHDPLTGIYNRRHAMVELERLIEVHQRHKTPFSLCMLDMDSLKNINDSLGHRAGDDAIKKLANAIRNSLRKGDIGARLAGDEFLILFPNTTANDAKACLHRAAKNLQLKPLDHDLCVTFCCGLYDYQQGSPSETLHTADTLLYKAKAEGKNHLCTEDHVYHLLA